MIKKGLKNLLVPLVVVGVVVAVSATYYAYTTLTPSVVLANNDCNSSCNDPCDKRSYNSDFNVWLCPEDPLPEDPDRHPVCGNIISPPGGGPQLPTASLSCSPEEGVVLGDPVTLTWSCGNSSRSVGGGFNTQGLTRDSVKVYPSSDTTYLVRCVDISNSGISVSATCNVETTTKVGCTTYTKESDPNNCGDTSTCAYRICDDGTRTDCTPVRPADRVCGSTPPPPVMPCERGNVCGQKATGIILSSGECSVGVPPLTGDFEDHGNTCDYRQVDGCTVAEGAGVQNCANCVSAGAVTVYTDGSLPGCEDECPATHPDYPECDKITLEPTEEGEVQLKAVPNLLRKGDIARLVWFSQNTTSCSITGSDGLSWTSLSQIGSKLSNKIFGETTFTLSCTEEDTNDTLSASVKVKVVPSWGEE